MPRDPQPFDEQAEPADKEACRRLEAALKRALWAKQASRSWAALAAATATQPRF